MHALYNGCFCREAGQSQQAADAGSPAMQAHPLAEPQAKPEQAPSVTAQGFAGSAEVASSSQAAGMSDELMDLFDSIHHLQQEVAALPSPEHVSPAGSGVQSRRPSTQVQKHISVKYLHAISLRMLNAGMCIMFNVCVHGTVAVMQSAELILQCQHMQHSGLNCLQVCYL